MTLLGFIAAGEFLQVAMHDGLRAGPHVKEHRLADGSFGRLPADEADPFGRGQKTLSDPYHKLRGLKN